MYQVVPGMNRRRRMGKLINDAATICSCFHFRTCALTRETLQETFPTSASSFDVSPSVQLPPSISPPSISFETAPATISEFSSPAAFGPAFSPGASPTVVLSGVMLSSVLVNASSAPLCFFCSVPCTRSSLNNLAGRVELDQEVCEISRVGSGREAFTSHGLGWVGSGHRDQTWPAKSDPTRGRS